MTGTMPSLTVMTVEKVSVWLLAPKIPLAELVAGKSDGVLEPEGGTVA